MSKPSPREIQVYKPTGLQGFACNDKAIQSLARFVNQNGEGANLALTGDVGSGKSSLAEVAIRTLFCSETNDAYTGPCGNCSHCRRLDFENSDTDLYAHEYEASDGQIKRLHYLHFNGFYLVEAQVKELKRYLHEFRKERTIIFLDEFQEISSPPIVGHLLKLLLKPECTWLVAGTDLRRLSPAVRRRLGVFAETTPSAEELVQLIRERCQTWGICWDSDETLATLAFKCLGTVSDYLNVLSQAAANERMLTLKLVNDHVFTR